MQRFAPKGESPQLTHFWNNMKLPRNTADHLDFSLMVHVNGDPEAIPRRGFWDFRFHLGGWPNYVVLAPEQPMDEWYVGWITSQGVGISQIPISRYVRMLRGPDNISFFGVRVSNHEQVGIRQVAEGTLGHSGPHARDPLH